MLAVHVPKKCHENTFFSTRESTPFLAVIVDVRRPKYLVSVIFRNGEHRGVHAQRHARARQNARSIEARGRHTETRRACID